MPGKKVGKKAGALGVVVALVVGWLVVREVAARQYAGDYLLAREIPTYHSLSFHTAGDRNLVGWCKPCGKKASSVGSDKLSGKLDEIEKAITGK